jgi:A/G-specific adenine glycosylase
MKPLAIKPYKMHAKENPASQRKGFVPLHAAVANHSPLSVNRPGFQRALLDWYQANQRVLPWRESPSLYKTVVSEFMLQQTQVKTVLPYFARWLAELPDFKKLSAASEEKVLKLWEGLGYYSRARNLHKLAQAVAALAEPPRSPEDWRELPGVGPYTAAAITSIAFSAPVACVDGNVVRILARLTADATEFRDSASAAKYFTTLATELVATDSPGDHNQAMMELGATVCHRQTPLCTVCPVLAYCAAARAGEPERFPRLATKKIEQQQVIRVWCEHDGQLLLHRAHFKARRLANQYELPRAGDLGLAEGDFKKLTPLAVRRRAITRYAITETIFRFPLSARQRAAAAQNTELSWVPLSDLAALTLSGPHRRWVGEILAASDRK